VRNVHNLTPHGSTLGCETWQPQESRTLHVNTAASCSALLAVIISVWGHVIRYRFGGPLLHVALRPHPTEKTVWRDAPSGVAMPMYFHHVLVSNSRPSAQGHPEASAFKLQKHFEPNNFKGHVAVNESM